MSRRQARSLIGPSPLVIKLVSSLNCTSGKLLLGSVLAWPPPPIPVTYPACLCFRPSITLLQHDSNEASQQKESDREGEGSSLTDCTSKEGI